MGRKNDDEKIETYEEEGARGLAIILQQLDEGRLHAEASEALQGLGAKLAELANSYGKAKGTFTLTLSLTAEDDGTISIDADVKTKEPKTKRARSLFWLTKGNNLTPDNPRQQKLPLREVPKAGPARDVGVEKPAARTV